MGKAKRKRGCTTGSYERNKNHESLKGGSWMAQPSGDTSTSRSAEQPEGKS